MKVVATRVGYYGLIRHFPEGDKNPRAGIPFDIKPEHFSQEWHKPVDSEAKRIAKRFAEAVASVPNPDDRRARHAAVVSLRRIIAQEYEKVQAEREEAIEKIDSQIEKQMSKGPKAEGEKKADGATQQSPI